jgi:hypothetical protein
MRDPARVTRVLEALREFWLAHPDLRLCQIVGNFLEDASTPDSESALHLREPQMSSRAYNIEDDVLERWLKEHVPRDA